MYDIKKLKEIPIEEIARKYNIRLEEKNGRLWGLIRDEKHTSFSINTKQNLWFDFGAGKGGSGIDLVSFIEKVTTNEAVKKLAEMFGIENVKIHKNSWSAPTDNQFRELGIEPELATMNFGIDLNVHSKQLISRWHDKYSMSMVDLAKHNPNVYNKIVTKLGTETINVLRDNYLIKIKSAVNEPDKKQSEFYLSWAESDVCEINRKVDLLQRAVYHGGDFSHLRVNVEKDFESIKHQIKEIDRSLGYSNEPLFEYFSKDLKIAMDDLNRSIYGDDSTVIPLIELKGLYKKLGNLLQESETELEQVLKDGYEISLDDKEANFEWLERYTNIKNDIEISKDLFNKTSKVVEGLCLANRDMYNAIHANGNERSSSKAFELSK